MGLGQQLLVKQHFPLLNKSDQTASYSPQAIKDYSILIISQVQSSMTPIAWVLSFSSIWYSSGAFV